MNRYIKNSTFGVLQLVFSIVIVFFSIPIFIQAYGLKIYGVFSIISIFGNLTLLFNLGINTTLLKFLTRENSEGIRNSHVSVSLVILGSITLFFSSLFLLSQQFIIGYFFEIDPAIKINVISSFRMFVFANIFIMLGQPLVALVQANNDFFRTSSIQFVYNVINGIGLIILSKLKAPFSFIALPGLISAMIWFLLLLYYSTTRYSFKFLKFSQAATFKEISGQQLKYSGQVYLLSLLSFFNEPLLKILVAKLFGVQAVGSFDIILRIKGQLVALFTKMFEPLSSVIASQQEKTAIRTIVHFSEQLALIVFIPLSLIIHFYSNVILKLWLKDISIEFAFDIKISVIIFTLSMIVVPNYYYLIFHGKVRECIIIQVIGILVSLIILFMGIFIGINPIKIPVISICLGIITAFIINLYYQYKYLRSIIVDYFSLLPLTILILLTALYIAVIIFQLIIMQYIILFLSIYVAGFYAYKIKKRAFLNIFD